MYFIGNEGGCLAFRKGIAKGEAGGTILRIPVAFLRSHLLSEVVLSNTLIHGVLR